MDVSIRTLRSFLTFSSFVTYFTHVTYLRYLLYLLYRVRRERPAVDVQPPVDVDGMPLKGILSLSHSLHMYVSYLIHTHTHI